MGLPTLDQVRGCVLGGAVGDALGAPFEGLWSESIPADLLEGYSDFEGYPRGQYTDDTQLTLATLESIVAQAAVNPADIARRIADLWRTGAVIGPGGACTAAADAILAGGHWSTSGAALGQAGNGTAMRTAVLGLWFYDHPSQLPPVVAEVSQITHRDPRSIAGGVAIAEAARLLALDPQIDGAMLCADVAKVMRPIESRFAQTVELLPKRMAARRTAVLEYLAWSDAPPDFPRPIITPYIMPTVLASLWAVMEHPSSWGGAVAAAIDLGGDVDTLGAIVGGLMGARLGLNSIPQHLAEGVLRATKLRKLSDRYRAVLARNLWK